MRLCRSDVYMRRDDGGWWKRQRMDGSWMGKREIEFRVERASLQQRIGTVVCRSYVSMLDAERLRRVDASMYTWPDNMVQ